MHDMSCLQKKMLANWWHHNISVQNSLLFQFVIVSTYSLLLYKYMQALSSRYAGVKHLDICLLSHGPNRKTCPPYSQIINAEHPPCCQFSSHVHNTHKATLL
ncbi:TPA: hypothetical protein ACH3X1_001574 [Trebouxia sp. C0004]